jgi:hypothetical protein
MTKPTIPAQSRQNDKTGNPRAVSPDGSQQAIQNMVLRIVEDPMVLSKVEGLIQGAAEN